MYFWKFLKNIIYNIHQKRPRVEAKRLFALHPGSWYNSINHSVWYIGKMPVSKCFLLGGRLDWSILSTAGLKHMPAGCAIRIPLPGSLPHCAAAALPWKGFPKRKCCCLNNCARVRRGSLMAARRTRVGISWVRRNSIAFSAACIRSWKDGCLIQFGKSFPIKKKKD